MNINRHKLLQKESCLLELLRTHYAVFVHIDTRHDGVVLPDPLLGRPQLALQLGLNLQPIPIPDLQIDKRGWSGTLTFGRLPSLCVVAWPAVFFMAGDSGAGGFWPDDCPPEARVKREGGRMPEPERGPYTPPRIEHEAQDRKITLPPGWRIIDGGKD